MELETKRLRLHPLTEKDAEGLFAYCSHPAVGPAAGWKPHETLEESREILEQVFLKEPPCVCHRAGGQAHWYRRSGG